MLLFTLSQRLNFNLQDPQMTDYSWEVQERAEQKDLFELHRRDRESFGSDEERNRRLEIKQKKVMSFHTINKKNLISNREITI